MRYNELQKEEKELRKIVNELTEIREELVSLLGTSEEVHDLLSDYRQCDEAIRSGTAAGDLLTELLRKRDELDELLNSSKNKSYIEKIARDQLGLYYPDDEIIYNGRND